MSINFNVRKLTTTKLSYYSFNFTQIIPKYQRFASNFRTSFRMKVPIIQLNKSLDIIKIVDKKDNAKVIHIIKETNTIKFNDLVSTTTYPSLPSNFIKMVFLKLLENKISTRYILDTYKVSPFELRYDVYDKGTRKRKIVRNQTTKQTAKETAKQTPPKITPETSKILRSILKKPNTTRKNITDPLQVSKNISLNATDPSFT